LHLQIGTAKSLSSLPWSEARRPDRGSYQLSARLQR